ncbi:hypothetical protein [Flavobacterium sp. 1355]|jgi:hypothetical protein|uniref:hypothetical protein n=1 Tax=Flavobacterium sp. 1355 TaxID=2806571 RepID=UPI001AE41CF0|nr:hypothetical protein [Flavobacterium sp. 1355]MBP1225275.1 hypothetical protein [Flavobacterium sp. 1355]
MATNTFSEEMEIKLVDFFANDIDPKDMAKSIRKVNYLLALNAMKEKGNLGVENLENCFYWLNELAEILNPYLEAE